MIPELAGVALLAAAAAPRVDWMLDPKPYRARVVSAPARHEISLENGLIRRVFRTSPNGATIAFDNLTTGVSMLRAVKPEATVELNGRKFAVGGLIGQPDLAYLDPAWLPEMKTDPLAFRFVGFEEGTPRERFAWKPKRRAANMTWPPPGAALTLRFAPPVSAPELQGLTVSVHYEMYDGIPALEKWIEVTNGTRAQVRLNRFENEVLAVVESDPAVESMAEMEMPPIHVLSDYAFCGGSVKSSNQTTFWEPDREFTSQINYALTAPVLLKSRPPIGPDALIEPGASFDAFRTFEILYDGDSRERRGLALRRLQRLLAPWATENPIIMHLRYSDSASIRHAVDQCAEVGFEMIILTFGSGLNLESQDPAYLARIKADVDYAHSKGIEIGGYTLTASRDAGPGNNVVAKNTPNPKTGSKGAVFGQSPCLASAWSDGYYARLTHFVNATGIDVIEDDGSYPGDICESTHHAHHRGLNDSQWAQWRTICGFYQAMRARDVYLQVPDYYFLSGSNRCPMGYRETNWSLPRDRQIVLGRQNIYDGTWEKSPSMGWMFVPLVEYQGGGAAATLEPLSEHLDAYEAHLAQNFGAGVQACYRGPRLYDTDRTRDVVKRWVDFYKRHRDILDSDIVHVRRPDGRGLDCILHVNAALRERGLAMVYNPTGAAVTADLAIPLYYTGLSDAVLVRDAEGPAKRVKIDRAYSAVVHVVVPAHGRTWLVFEAPARQNRAR